MQNFWRLYAVGALIVMLGAGYALYTVRKGETAASLATSTVQAATGTTSTGSKQPLPTVETGKSVRIAGTVVKVDIADTPDTRQMGLSGRPGLEKDEGMLFIFPDDGLHGFWMKDMRFSIDILWLDSAGKVVHIVENAPPESFPESFSPEKPARFVLELSAGSVERLGIELGDIAVLPQ